VFVSQLNALIKIMMPGSNFNKEECAKNTPQNCLTNFPLGHTA